MLFEDDTVSQPAVAVYLGIGQRLTLCVASLNEMGLNKEPREERLERRRRIRL